MWLFGKLPHITGFSHVHTHTITQLVWGFRYLDTSYPDKGRLIQKSTVCWDYVPSGNGLRTGKEMMASSQRCRKFTAAARTPSTARRVS